MKANLFKFFTTAILFSGSFNATAEELEISKLTVKGEGALYKPADQMELNIAVVTQNIDSKLAVKTNNEKMELVISRLNKVGLTAKEIQTGQFMVQPIYHYPGPKEEQAGPTITHYETTNTLQIKTKQLDLIEKIIGAAVESGANRLDQIVFNLSDPQLFRNEVIHLAAKHAMEDANSLAHAAQVKLVRVLSLDLDPNQTHYPVPRMMMASKAESMGSFDAPIEAGQVEMKASVNMTFEIAPIY
ncbi:MAG: SIMPL domain-containing protein [Candidatus Protochlamydia sp.]|nr:SIMPL domain-containing protein [Candidatus Protochlamydia sp.]